MKTIKYFAFAAIVAVTSVVGFTSCKDGAADEPKKDNQQIDNGYNGETVKTQFLISIAENVSSTRNRMPAATIQDGGTRAEFRGMDSIVLIPFSDGNYVTRNGRNIVLGAIEATAGTNAGQMNAKNSVFYEDVAIPLGTNHFLFYGKAIDNTADAVITSDADMHKFGFVESSKLRDPSIATASNYNPADISFKLKSIYSTASSPAKSTEIATLLTNIANAADGTASWTAEATSNAALYALHNDFITLTASSSYSVQRTLQDLYNTLKRYQLTQVTPDAAANAVIAAIEVGATVTGSAIPYTLALKDDYAGYPANVNLPDGAAKVEWDSANQRFNVAVNTVGDITVSSFNQYTYPASLQYYGESDIKTSPNSKKEFYDGVNTWAQILSQYENDDATVNQSTKSVALKSDINYAVGQFKVNVKHAAALKDQKGHAYNIPAEGIVWTGVLIGGQKIVDYKFEQKSAETATYVIYDNDLNGNTGGEVKLETANVKSNSTLVFGTKDNTDKNDQIYFALEFINKGADFYGKDGKLIPAGGKYYLVGSLKADGSEANHPANYNIFYKDFRTVANVTLSENTSLANAYNVIPDLRSQGLELGFSVDLVWQDGLSFDVNL